MTDQDWSLADPVDSILCALSSCSSSTPSSSIAPSSSSITPPIPDVSSTTTHFPTSIHRPFPTTTPAAIPMSTSSSSPPPQSAAPTPTQSPQPISLPVNIVSSANSSEPKSITTTILSTSGVQVITITSVVENPAAILNQSDNNISGPNSFMSNRAAMIGVFTAVGVTTLVLLLTLVLCIFRRRQERRQLEKDHAAAATGARGFIEDEDELGNEKGWWHGSSGTTLPGAHPVYFNSGPLEYSRPYVGGVHPYASAIPTQNRMAPPVDNHQAYIPNHDSPSTDFGSTTNAHLTPSTVGHDMPSSSFGHVPQQHGESTHPLPGWSQESSGDSTHPYASTQRHTVYELLAGDVLAQQSPHHGLPVQHASTEMAARVHSSGHLTTSTPVVHHAPFATASDLFVGGSRSGSTEKEQWYDDTDSDSQAESGKGGMMQRLPSVQQGLAEQAKSREHDPRFSGLFGQSTAWAPTYLHQPRESVDAGTIREEEHERYWQGRLGLTVANP